MGLSEEYWLVVGFSQSWPSEWMASNRDRAVGGYNSQAGTSRSWRGADVADGLFLVNTETVESGDNAESHRQTRSRMTGDELR